MKKLYYCLIAALALVSCGDGVNLPDPGVEKDLNKVPTPEKNLDELMEIPLKDESTPMIHCGALHTPEDFEYVKARLAEERDPWQQGYEKLVENYHSHLDYVGNPQVTIVRGGSGETYMRAANDAAAAYQLGLRYHLGDGEEYAALAVSVMDGWANTCTTITGTTDQALAAGLYGYEFAVAGELLRDYWMEHDPDGFSNYQQWMVDVFYKANHEFLTNHFGTPPLHYWANWGLCNIASMISIGILADRRDIYNEAIEHLQIGETSGRMTNAIYHVFDGEWANFAQWQENGRDAGHTSLCQGLMGTICQLTWNQGDDFFGYNDNMYLKACEYNGRYYTAGLDVPYVTYVRVFNSNWGVAEETYDKLAPNVGEDGARVRMTGSIWACAYYHYAKIKGVDPEKCQYTKMGMEASMPEVGGVGSTSGGYDQLGFGTLMYTRE